MVQQKFQNEKTNYEREEVLTKKHKTKQNTMKENISLQQNNHDEYKNNSNETQDKTKDDMMDRNKKQHNETQDATKEKMSRKEHKYKVKTQ